MDFPALCNACHKHIPLIDAPTGTAPYVATGTLKPQMGRGVLALRTGWDGDSNKDTRAAAFFGWLALKTGV